MAELLGCPGRPEFWVGSELCGGHCGERGTHHPILVARYGSQTEHLPLTQLYCRGCTEAEPSRWDLPTWYEGEENDEEPDWRETEVTAELLFEREPSLYRTVRLWLQDKNFPVPKRHEFYLDWRRA